MDLHKELVCAWQVFELHMEIGKKTGKNHVWLAWDAHRNYQSIIDFVKAIYKTPLQL